MSCTPSHSSDGGSSAGSVSGFPEEDLREGGRGNPGYFPARLGQSLLQGRYCIVRKLGWGQYSSVWLAKDRTYNFFCLRQTSLSGSEQKSDEVKLLEKIANAQPLHRGFRYNLFFHESFEFMGPHGGHRCLVTEVLGFSLDYVRKIRDDGDYRLSVSTAKRVIKQILCGLEYLHDVCGIIHAGNSSLPQSHSFVIQMVLKTDLKHDNILFRPLDVSSVVAHELVANPSVSYDCGTEVSPSIVPIVSQGLPLSAVPSIREELLEAVIADVGHSHWQTHHFQELIQPRALRAPEVILGYPWNASADIWNLGCLATELLIGFWLFEANSEKGWEIDEDHLARVTEALETTFDPSFLSKCKHKDMFFKADGSFAHFTSHEEPTWPLRKLLEQFSHLGEGSEDLHAAERFLRRCLRLVPEERATAKDLVDDPWLADVDLSKA
ncbi:kinase-like protein [Fistulina hepatica ATCC 64428]|uniref:non-specific serine/threonine protein kinase n=1 Tax=Fistulina hepatica ATCC 64428 TaxID=1128425 RepID=A0A0D7ANN2_9AGAR|nr:kinase-like protein [Fistulina hepatica ATCC 64428]